MVDIQNANDVQLFVERSDFSAQAGTQAGRLVVDDFSVTTEEDNTLESGVGRGGPAGHSRGNKTHSWSFTLKGEDKALFLNIVMTADGSARDFDFEARGLTFTVKAESCRHNSVEFSGSDGETTEWAVDGTAVGANYADSGRGG